MQNTTKTLLLSSSLLFLAGNAISDETSSAQPIVKPFALEKSFFEGKGLPKATTQCLRAKVFLELQPLCHLVYMSFTSAKSRCRFTNPSRTKLELMACLLTNLYEF